MTVADSPTSQRMKIHVDGTKCSGCRMCELTCSFVHEREVNPRRARVCVLTLEKEGMNAPLLCVQCKKCLDACKRGALSWDEDLEVVRVTKAKCNLCGLCIKACPEDAIVKDPISKTVNICDKCNGDPECIKWCPEGVLTWVDAHPILTPPPGQGGPPGGPPSSPPTGH